MSKELKQKPIGWLKGVLSNQNANDVDKTYNEADLPIESETAAVQSDVQQEPDEPLNNKMQYLKDNQDKVTLDIISAVENLLNDRQLVIYKKQGLEEQLNNANETITKLKFELTKKEQTILDNEKEISNLEEKLTSKQMSYDQLLEDYKEYQKTSNNSIDNLKYQLEKETGKYNKLSEEFSNYQYQNMQKIAELEERIRDLEVENQKITEQNNKVLEEKNKLLQTFNDFSERMSISFTHTDKPKSPSSSE
jgi:chromosome segregation ATPase